MVSSGARVPSFRGEVIKKIPWFQGCLVWFIFTWWGSGGICYMRTESAQMHRAAVEIYVKLVI